MEFKIEVSEFAKFVYEYLKVKKLGMTSKQRALVMMQIIHASATSLDCDFGLLRDVAGVSADLAYSDDSKTYKWCQVSGSKKFYDTGDIEEFLFWLADRESEEVK